MILKDNPGYSGALDLYGQSEGSFQRRVSFQGKHQFQRLLKSVTAVKMIDEFCLAGASMFRNEADGKTGSIVGVAVENHGPAIAGMLISVSFPRSWTLFSATSIGLFLDFCASREQFVERLIESRPSSSIRA